MRWTTADGATERSDRMFTAALEAYGVFRVEDALAKRLSGLRHQNFDALAFEVLFELCGGPG